IIGIIAPVSAAISSENKVYSIESKEKAVKYKVTWNGNGGKIGSKKTTVTYVKKGSKVGKLATPKRSGYTFKGWYTKKSGGKKITKNTKPVKSVTYFAQWTKTTSASKIVGHWQGSDTIPVSGYLYRLFHDYYFHANGKFQYKETGYSPTKIEGKYSVSNGKVYLKEMKYFTAKNIEEMNKNIWTFQKGYSDMTTEYKLASDKNGNYLKIKQPVDTDYYNRYHYTLDSAITFSNYSYYFNYKF
ncbi:MAG: InlB B-repeat-containing protein, partial [Methanobrevibacter sp.]|nr:InlB B-repeat-containing protein [Methanobrevibacter sp.]